MCIEFQADMSLASSIKKSHDFCHYWLIESKENIEPRESIEHSKNMEPLESIVG